MSVQTPDIFDEIDNAFQMIRVQHPSIYHKYDEALADSMSYHEDIIILDLMRRDIELRDKGYEVVKVVCDVRD